MLAKLRHELHHRHTRTRAQELATPLPRKRPGLEKYSTLMSNILPPATHNSPGRDPVIDTSSINPSFRRPTHTVHKYVLAGALFLRRP
jgi:hypothetical protein